MLIKAPPPENHVYHTSGRSPALSGTTVFHAVNSVWEDNTGHAIEGEDNGQGLFEGCVFKDVATVVLDDFKGQLFGASGANLDSCEAALGRACEANTLTGSGAAFGEGDTSFFSSFAGLTIAPATSAAEAETNVLGNVGCGKLSSSSSSPSNGSSSTGGNKSTVSYSSSTGTTSSASDSKSSKCKRSKKLRRSLMAESQLQSVSSLLW